VSPVLLVALEDGFLGDRVEVRVGGREALRLEGVSTKRLTGLAETHEVEVERGAVPVEVRVEGRGRAALTLEVADRAWLAVRARGDEVELVPLAGPPGYA
jgi:hypothetical protein